MPKVRQSRPGENAIGFVHDPSVGIERVKSSEETAFAFSTGDGVPLRRSSDLTNWTFVGAALSGDAFPKGLPIWAEKTVPGVKNPWAPDISKVGGEWRLYYSLSTFGSQVSAIGLATRPTLDPSDARPWTDRGAVIVSKKGDPYNAIDPAAVLDGRRAYLSFGSFWGGIHLFELDSKTGLRKGDSPPVQIAWRPQAPHAIEAPVFFKRGGWWYLFVSFDFCCRGERSTYNQVVGRSKSILGPFVDRANVPMRDGGGSAFVSGSGDIFGPGHGSVFSWRRKEYVAHHFYDGKNRGRPTLQIRPITWDSDGWPIAGPPLVMPPAGS